LRPGILKRGPLKGAIGLLRDVIYLEFEEITEEANPESSVSAQPETGLLLNKPREKDAR
jgi:hypothetical protein